MKKMNIGLRMSVFFLVLLNIGITTSPTYAIPSENQITLTEVFADRTDVSVGESVFFTIHVTANGIPVPNGNVTVREETDPIYVSNGTISDGIAIIEWYAQSWTPTGWCTINATYEGSEGYDTSSNITQVAVNSPIIPGTKETETDVTSNIVDVYSNDIVNFNVIVTYLGSFFPFFDGGYITLVDTTENIVLQRHDIEFKMAQAYVASMSFTIPSWYVKGDHIIESRYTGSIDSGHAASVDFCVINMIENDIPPPPEVFTISMMGNTTVIDYEDGVLQIDATIDGNDPTGKILRLHSYQDDRSIQHLLEELTVTSRDYSYIFEPSPVDQLGSILFELTLEDPSTQEIKATADISATIEETITIYETIISLNQDPIETTYGIIEIIPVYITSSSGDLITEGQLYCDILDEDITLLELVADISQGIATFEVPIEDFGEGNYQLRLDWLGNATQSATTHTATLSVAKGTPLLNSEINSNMIQYGENTSWSAYVSNYLGNPIANIPISFDTSLTGFYWDHWGTVMTDENGYATIEIIWTDEHQVHYGSPGTYTVRITIEENNMVTSRLMTHSLVVTENAVILTLNDVSVVHLGIAILEGTLMSSTSEPISNALITLYWNGTATETWEELTTTTTNTFGQYFSEIEVILSPKCYGLRAEYDGDNNYDSSSQTAILEVLDNPSEFKKIDITPTTLDLGDIVEIKVNATDPDSISSVTAIIYNDNYNISIPLDYQDDLFQKTIWCDTQYQLGIWAVDLIIIDELGIESTFTNVGQFHIMVNPAPNVIYNVTQDSIPDGSSVEFQITATDSLGIASVKIEIEHTIYDITQNNNTSSRNGQFSTLFGNEQNSRDILYYLRAREENSFSFYYTPQSVGSVPFTIYVEDYAGQQKILNGSIMVEAVAPELSVASMSSLNGTAPFSFSLVLNGTDGSGINYICLYTNNEEHLLQYIPSTDQWEISMVLSASDYALIVIAEDNVGTQATLDLGILSVSQAVFEIFFENENLYDGEATNFTIQGDVSLSNATVDIIWGNQNMTLILDSNAIVTSELTFSQPDTYIIEVIITDQMGIQLTQNYSFDIAAKGPEFEAVYPDAAMIAEFRNPFTLELEALVTDASGINSVVLYADSAAYPLINSFDVWNTNVDFNEGTYTLKLVATDYYGTETIYELGEMTIQKISSSVSEPIPVPSSNPPQTSKNENDSIEPAVGMIILVVVAVSGGLIVYWRKKPKPTMITST
jgi:hypothetical protein